MNKLFLLAAVFFISSVSADTVLLFETTNPRTPDRIEIKDSKIRLSNVNDPIVTLFDKKKKKLTFVNQQDKTYFEVTKKGLKKIVKAIRKIQDQMKQGLSEDQQANVDKIFKKQGLAFNPEANLQTIKKVKSTNVKGVDCDVYVATRADQVLGSYCIANARYLGVNSSDFHTYLTLMQFLKNASFGLSSIDPAMQNGFNGMPIISYDANNQLVSKFVSISGNNLDKALFKVPDGFEKIKQPN